MRYISIFSGIEAASVAFHPLGWEPVAFSEIDPFPSAVLAHRYPDVPNLGDITKIDWKPYRGKVDLVVGGSPCQSFSYAGKREGLKGESGLMFEFIRCVREVRPRWLLWENVPGALSSEHGAAFGQLLHELADGGGYGLSWRVLDAQFFGVAQRRRRLFLIGRAGDGYEEACQVLFEPEVVPGNYTSGRGKRAELAARARRSLESAGFCNSSIRERDYANAGNPTNVWSLMSDGSTQKGANGIGYDGTGAAYTLNTVDRRSVAIATNQRGEVRLDGGIPSSRSGKQMQAVLCMASGLENAEIGHDLGTTLCARQYKDPPIICGETVGALCARDYKGVGSEYVSEGKVVANTQVDAVGHRYIVRRLTPRECERLQGFPDDWTLVPYRGKSAGECPDGPRYKAIGNSMAVPVMRWIGRRIQMMDDDGVGA